jgi:hypothetical protein
MPQAALLIGAGMDRLGRCATPIRPLRPSNPRYLEVIMFTLNRIPIIVTGIAIALATSVSAQAQPPGMGPYATPGGLSWGSPGAAARGPTAFSAMDRNADGYLSKDEFAQHRAERIAARAAQGRPLRNAGNAPVFEQWDRNDDGRLSSGELDLGRQARFANRRGMMPGAAYGGGPRQGFGSSGRPCWRNR